MVLMARESTSETVGHAAGSQSRSRLAQPFFGGEIPEGKDYFDPPTVLENVAPGQPAYDDELVWIGRGVDQSKGRSRGYVSCK